MRQQRVVVQLQVLELVLPPHLRLDRLAEAVGHIHRRPLHHGELEVDERDRAIFFEEKILSLHGYNKVCATSQLVSV